MAFKRRIFVSVPDNHWLTENQLRFKRMVIEKIKESGFQPETIFEEGESHNLLWSFENVEKVIKKCVGAIVIGFPRWHFVDTDTSHSFPTEYSHYEAAIINASKIPSIMFAPETLTKRGAFDEKAGKIVYRMPEDVGIIEWSNTDKFKRPFEQWLSDIKSRYDLFLGYCGKSESTASKIELFLIRALNLKVKNWQLDFVGATSILSEIEKADHECTGGIFLFTKDDQIESGQPVAAPRDNVIFEAGYFIKSKGKEKVIIIREKDAKMPADLGGDIYLHLEDKNNTSAIETRLRDFVESRL